MSLLSSILGSLTAPKNDMGVIDADNFVNATITGSSKNDKLTYDVRDLHGTNTSNFTSLDGGKGFDTLTLQLTESQHAAMKAEMKAKLGGMFNDGLDLGELVTLFKVFTGQQYVKIDSLDLQLKGWESVKFEVSADPIVTLAPSAPSRPAFAPPAPTYIDERGNFSRRARASISICGHNPGVRRETPRRTDVTHRCRRTGLLRQRQRRYRLQLRQHTYTGSASPTG